MLYQSFRVSYPAQFGGSQSHNYTVLRGVLAIASVIDIERSDKNVPWQFFTLLFTDYIYYSYHGVLTSMCLAWDVSRFVCCVRYVLLWKFS